MSGAYYNDLDPLCCAVLRTNIDAGRLPAGVVDERSITDLRAAELRGYRQWHLFAGIGGLPLALRLAGVPDDASILTGGFPCQDISYAGKGAGLAGARSGLWYEMARLIGDLRPRYVFVENVRALLGRGLDTVTGDLAARGYDCVWQVVSAASVGAPHRRERVFLLAWLADALSERAERRGGPGDMVAPPGTAEGPAQERQRLRDSTGDSRADVAHSYRDWQPQQGGSLACVGRWPGDRRGPAAGMADATGHGTKEQQIVSDGAALDRPGPGADGGTERWSTAQGVWRGGGVDAPGAEGVRGGADLADAAREHDGYGHDGEVTLLGAATQGDEGGGHAVPDADHGTAQSRVGDALDGVSLRLAGLEGFPGWPAGPGEEQHAYEPPRLAEKVPQRVAKLKALGNAVVPQQAASAFVMLFEVYRAHAGWRDEERVS